MRLLPDQIPNPFHFLAEYHERVVPLFMTHVELVHNGNPDTFGSTEPCWRWKGATRVPDLHVDMLGYFKEQDRLAIKEDFKEDPDLLIIKREPVFDMALVLTEEEKRWWSSGQLQHLQIHPRLISWCMRQGQWRQVYEVFDLPHFYATCLGGECVQSWHLIQTTPEDDSKRVAYEAARLKVIQFYKKRKLRYEVALSKAAKFGHPTNDQRGGPRLIVGSAEYVRREEWVALYSVKLEKALKVAERRFISRRGGSKSGRAFEIPNEELRDKILETATRVLNQSDECWVVANDLVNERPLYTGNQLVYFEGDNYSLRRALFVVYTNTHIPKNSMIRRTCKTRDCYTPSHQSLVI